jgi:hypothetical protein
MVTLAAWAVVHQAAPLAETSRTFEVVSLKPSKEDQPGARWRILPGGRVEFRNTLKVGSATAAVDVLVIEHVERPSPD